MLLCIGLLLVLLLRTTAARDNILLDSWSNYNKMNSANAYPGFLPPVEVKDQEELNRPETPEPSSMDYVNSLKAKDYRMELESHRNDLVNYGQQYVANLQEQTEYKMRVMREKLRALDMLRRQEYVDQVKQMRQELEPENTRNLPDNTHGGTMLTEHIDNYEIVPREVLKKSRAYAAPTATQDQVLSILQKRFGLRLDDSEDDRERAAALKRLLLSEKTEALREGVLPLLQKLPTLPPRPTESPVTPPSEDQESNSECSMCRGRVDKSLLAGTWTAMFLVPKVAKHKAKTLFSLKNPGLKTPATASLECISVKFAETIDDSADILIRFSSDSVQINGTFSVENENVISISSDLFSNRACIVDAGPNGDYLIAFFLDGSTSCRSVQLWSKYPATVIAKHIQKINEKMTELTNQYGILPMGPVPHPDKCL